MSANYSRAVVVSTPSQFTVTQASLPSAAVNGSKEAVWHFDTHWGDSVPPEKQGVPLSAEETEQLQECEGFVKAAQSASLDAGLALARIRGLHLYRADFRCFKDYCLERWRYGKAYSYHLIAGAQIVKWLSPAGDISPRCEWQVRPMVASNLTKDEAATVWARAVTLAEGDEPSVSIIIPTLNCAATLEPCLSAIVNSTFRDYEIIVVDGQSTDRTLDIARQFAHQLLIPSSNRERGDARNHGIRAATGEILVFSDADNVMKPDTLSVIVDYLTRHPATVGKKRHRFRSRLARPIGERRLNTTATFPTCALEGSGLA
jgi:hypothetical protein